MRNRFIVVFVVAAVLGLTAASALAAQDTASGGAAPPSGKAKSSRHRKVKLPKIMQKIAMCESGGNPRAISPSGRYRGKWQFDRPTWRSLGGRGDPAKASEYRQDTLAMKLYHMRGTKPWPDCARRVNN
jgi:Transglycosylase-like domain